MIIPLAVILLVVFLNPAVPSEPYTVVVLKSIDIKPYNDVLEGFKRSCICEVKEVSLSAMKTGDMAGKVTAMKPDAVLTIGIDAMKYSQAIKHIPVIYTMIPLPHSGILKQNNISGICMDITPAKQFDVILDVFPGVKRVGLIYDPSHMEEFVQEAQDAAKSKRIELVIQKTFRSEEVFALIERMKGKIDVFWMLPDTTVVNTETVNSMLLFSFGNRVPIFTFAKKYVEMGAVAGLVINPYDIGIQAGEMAKKLVTDGKDQGPVRSNPRKTVLTINRKVAKKLGIHIRDEISRKADIIE